MNNNNKKYDLLWKLHDYKRILNALEEIATLLKSISTKTWYEPYQEIEKELDDLIYKFYKKYKEIYQEFLKIKKYITIDDIISIEY